MGAGMRAGRRRRRPVVYVYRPDAIDRVHLLSPHDMLRNLELEARRQEEGEACVQYRDGKAPPRCGPGPLSDRFHVDVFDGGDSLRLVAEIPGTRRENISLHVGEDRVVITARIEEEREVSGCYCVTTRARSATYRRTVGLPARVDPDGARARYRNGVLEVTLPKHTASGPKKEVRVE